MVLKVVLFTNGVGADPTKYRPDADDSQWWNRRDALVRCVSAFLCGPQALPPLSTIHNNHHHHHHVDNTTMSAHGGGGSRELVIVHDQDWSCLHLSYHHPNDTSPTVPPLRLPMLVPTERNVIAVWKRAAKFPGKLIQENGLSCRLVVSDIPTISPFDSAATTTTTNVDYTKSKRDLLEYLQATCSIDFLRQHKLNSALVTLVRKSNKDKLMAIKKEWERLHPAPKKQKKFKEEAFMDNDEGAVLALKSILVRVLRPSSSSIQRVIAATLHESSNDELPCWDEGFRMAPPPAANASLKTTDEEESCSALQICLFLGAVRDMLPSEHRCLRNVCRVGSVPLLNIRLGPIPEFTSKILTVTAFHHAHGRLHPAVLKLLQNQQQQTQQQLSFGGRGVDFPNASTAVVVPRVMMAAPFPSPPLLLLHFVCWVPLPSDRLSVRLEDRRTTRVLWCMVRCTVTSLWRSKVAAGGGGCHSDSSSSSSSRCGAVLSNRIMFVFQDGAKLTLRQEDLVRSMSEQHQAAPCEYQIMTMLRTKLDVTRPVEKNLVSDGKSASKAIWNHLLEVDKCKPSCLVDFDNPSDIADCSDTPHLFYSSLGVGSRQGSTTTTTRFPTVENESTTTMFMIVLPIYPDTDAADTTAGEVSMALWSERQRALVRVVRKKKIPVVPGRSIVNTTATSGGRLVMDQEASIITMVQHLGYQGRLLNLLLRT